MMRSNRRKVTNPVEKADGAPVPLPPSAWRVTDDLQNAIERCLTEAGHQILDRRFSDRDYRHWHLQLLYGQTIEVSVDNQVNPGSLKIVVCGKDDPDPIRTLLNCYHKIPILKISTRLSAGELFCKVPEFARRLMPWSLTDRLKFAVRYFITTTKYKIVGENTVYPSTWVVCLNTTEQFVVKGFSTCARSGLAITGFGTDLRRLEELIAVFDADGEFAIDSDEMHHLPNVFDPADASPRFRPKPPRATLQAAPNHDNRLGGRDHPRRNSNTQAKPEPTPREATIEYLGIVGYNVVARERRAHHGRPGWLLKLRADGEIGSYDAVWVDDDGPVTVLSPNNKLRRLFQRGW
jgi:hypothetical protein